MGRRSGRRRHRGTAAVGLGKVALGGSGRRVVGSQATAPPAPPEPQAPREKIRTRAAVNFSGVEPYIQRGAEGTRMDQKLYRFERTIVCSVFR